MKVKCFAKLNLTLNVFEKRGQFHPIDSIVTSIDIFDEVEVSLCKSGVRADGAAKAALSVADTLCGQYGCGCNIAVKSGIPLGAGLGGSSAQAAAVAYCLASLNGKSVSDEQVKAACALSGSDVNYMLLGGLCRITGKGDEVKQLHVDDVGCFVLTTFSQKLLSGRVYAAWDELAQKPPIADNDAVERALRRGYLDAAPLFSNCLQAAAESLSRYADGFRSISPRSVMTGSGSAYYLCCGEAEAEKLARELRSCGFDSTVCRTVSQGIEVIS